MSQNLSELNSVFYRRKMEIHRKIDNNNFNKNEMIHRKIKTVFLQKK
jgi:hypothetical protein